MGQGRDADMGVTKHRRRGGSTMWDGKGCKESEGKPNGSTGDQAATQGAGDPTLFPADDGPGAEEFTDRAEKRRYTDRDGTSLDEEKAAIVQASSDCKAEESPADQTRGYYPRPRSLVRTFIDTFLGRAAPGSSGQPHEKSAAKDAAQESGALPWLPDVEEQSGERLSAEAAPEASRQDSFAPSGEAPQRQYGEVKPRMFEEDIEDWEAREQEVLEAEATAPSLAQVHSLSESADAETARIPDTREQKKPGFWTWFWSGKRTTGFQAAVAGQNRKEKGETEAPATPGTAGLPGSPEYTTQQEPTSNEAGQVEDTEAPLPQKHRDQPETKAQDKPVSSDRPRCRTLLDWFLGRSAIQPEAVPTDEALEVLLEQPQAPTSTMDLTVPETPPTETIPAAAATPVSSQQTAPEGLSVGLSTQEDTKDETASGIAMEERQPTEAPSQPSAQPQIWPAEKPAVEAEEAASCPKQVAGPQDSAPTDVQVPGRCVESPALSGQQRALLDHLSGTAEAEATEAEVSWREQTSEKKPRQPWPKPSPIVRIGGGLVLVLVAVAAIKLHEAAQLRSFLALPIAGRAVIAAVPTPGETNPAANFSPGSIVTRDVPAFEQLVSLVGTKPENQPPPAVAGRYYYNGSWNQLLARLEAPPETLQLMLIPLTVSAEKQANGQEAGYEDVVVTIEPRGGQILVTCTEPGRWPPNEVFECFAYAGGETAEAVRDINGRIALDTWAQAGRKQPKPVTEADFGPLARVVNEAGREVWPIKAKTVTLPDGAVLATHQLEKGTITVTRGTLEDGRKYEEWSASSLPGYKLIAVWAANQDWPKDENRVAVLLGHDLRPILAYGKLPLWPGTVALWCRWYPGAGPQCSTVKDCIKALENSIGVQVVINDLGTVVAALRPEGTHATLRELLDPQSEWQTRWQMRPAPMNERERRMLQRVGYAREPSGG